ncbi:Protochlorophyllide reductase A [Durusdinium trenchii]|uniref:protochlorophyllide reductase n=1 Tax=Durusdinium trenchii TaxID=1381693 RepID=A0ABP0MHN7_9DINO
MARKGSQFGDKKLVVITGTSSGLGKATTKALLNAKEYHVIGAVRDLEKMAVVAELEGFDPERFTAMQVDLASFESVKNFTKAVDKFRGDRPIDRLVCNAAVYQPTLDYPKWTVDGHEQQLQINYLSHFLLTSGIMPMMTDSEDARVVMIGSVTGNDNTVGGGGVYPIADLKDLDGLELGCKKPIAMMDGYNFNGAKMYKDTKLALMMTSNMLHERFHRSTGISFSSIYPGCIAETPLFREKRPWFRKYFPIFMKYITGGYVGEEEAGTRLFQVIHDPKCVKSGVYWSWNGGPREGRGLEAMEKGGQIVGAGGAGGGWESIYENDQSDKVLNKDLMQKLWQETNAITGAKWPKAYQAKSPCPTLKVVGAATSLLGIMEEKARMKASRNGEGAKIVADKTLPKEERRKSLEKMLAALDKTPTDPEELEKDLLRTSGHVPDSVFKGSKAGEAVADEALEADEADVDGFTFEVPELDEPENKEPPKMIKGHELLGDTPVVFQPQNVMTMARAGQALSEVASQADVFIRYKCKKGKCKTCAVNIDGKWVSACQTKIPRQTESGKNFEVRVRQVSDAHKMAEKAAFFTPKSFADGVVNNGLGMVGFVKEAFGADPDFQVRMEREKKVEELLAQRRQSLKVKQSTLRGGNVPHVQGMPSTPRSETVDEHGREFVVPGVAMTAAFMFALIQKYLAQMG